MHLVLGIHCSSVYTEEIAHMISEVHAKDKNSYFLFFKYGPPNEIFLDKLRRVLPESIQKNIVEVRFNKNMSSTRTRYDGYSESFSKIISSLKNRLKRGERVSTIAVGGSAKVCFSNINHAAQTEVKNVFRGRVATQYTHLPLVTGSEYTAFLKYQKPAMAHPRYDHLDMMAGRKRA